MRKYLRLSILLPVLSGVSCTKSYEHVPTMVTITMQASEPFDTNSSEILIFDAEGYYKEHYTDEIVNGRITFSADEGARYLLVLINAENFAVTPLIAGETHFSRIEITPTSQTTEDNPFLWFGYLRVEFSQGRNLLTLTKTSSVGLNLKIDPWNDREINIEF